MKAMSLHGAWDTGIRSCAAGLVFSVISCSKEPSQLSLITLLFWLMTRIKKSFVAGDAEASQFSDEITVNSAPLV